MNFSIFLWCMKNLILHCILHSLTFHSFHNVNLSKHEKCENRFENSSEFKMYSQLYEKKVLCFHFLIPSAFTLRFLWDNVLKHTPALRACNSFAKVNNVRRKKFYYHLIARRSNSIAFELFRMQHPSWHGEAAKVSMTHSRKFSVFYLLFPPLSKQIRI